MDSEVKLYVGKTHTQPLIEDPMSGGRDVLTDEILSVVRNSQPVPHEDAAPCPYLHSALDVREYPFNRVHVSCTPANQGTQRAKMRDVQASSLSFKDVQLVGRHRDSVPLDQQLDASRARRLLARSKTTPSSRCARPSSSGWRPPCVHSSAQPACPKG